jgi:hypothetical protein
MTESEGLDRFFMGVYFARHFPDFARVVNLWWFDSPMGIFEMALSFWLLFKGLRPSGIAEADGLSIRQRNPDLR